MSNKLVCSTETQHRALKLQIYPSQEQEILINKTFGCVRQIYNNRLYERNQFYENVIKPANPEDHKVLWNTAHFSSEKEMKAKFPYLAEVSSQALCSATMFAETAFEACSTLKMWNIPELFTIAESFLLSYSYLFFRYQLVSIRSQKDYWAFHPRRSRSEIQLAKNLLTFYDTFRTFRAYIVLLNRKTVSKLPTACNRYG